MPDHCLADSTFIGRAFRCTFQTSIHCVTLQFVSHLTDTRLHHYKINSCKRPIDGRYRPNQHSKQNIMKNISQARQSCAKVRPSAKHTSDSAVATPTVSGVFLRPKISVYGRDGRSGDARRTATSVCLTSRPPAHLKQCASGYQPQVGVETMPTGTPTTTPTAAPHEATNQATFPSYQQLGTCIQIATSTSKSLDDSVRKMLIDCALTKAKLCFVDGAFPQSLGQALVATRHLKQLCDEANGGAK